MTKRISVALTLLILLGVSTPGLADNKVKVSVSLPLSGLLATIGAAVRSGIEIAQTLEPEKLAHIEFVFDDNQYDAKRALNSFQQVASGSETSLFYVWGSPTCMPIVPVAERAKRPLVCFSGDPKPNRRYVFSFNNPASDYAGVIQQQIAKLSGARVAILYSEIPFYQSLAESLTEQASRNGTSLQRHSVLPDTQDFASIIGRFRVKKHDVVALFLLPHQLPTFLKQASTVGYEPHIIGADTFSDLDPALVAAENSRDATYVDMRVSAAFESHYTAKTKSRSNVAFAYNGYHFAIAAAQVVTASGGSTDVESIVEGLRDYKSSDGEVRARTTAEFGQHIAFPIELKKVAQ